MPLEILPPELTATKASSTEKKPYDSHELLPSKIESGSSEEFRLLGTYATGHMLAPWRCAVEIKQPDGSLRFGGYDYSTNYEGFPDRARQTDWSTPERRKIEDEFVKPKRAFCALIWSYERDRVEVLVAEQGAIKSGIVEVLSDEDFSFDNDIADFVLKISKQGQKLETTYSLMPKPRKIEAKVKAAFGEVKDTATMDTLLRGSHPLLQPTQFSSNPAGDTEF